MQKTFTDQEIVDGLLSKDSLVVNAIVRFLYRQCQPGITRMVTNRKGSIADAEDLFQEVILVFLQNTWDGRFQLRSDVKVTTYIYRVATLMWQKEGRKQSTRMERESVYGMGPADEPRPEEEIINGEEVKLARDIIGLLDEVCQKLLKAFYFDEKSMKEIAEELGLGTEDNAKTKKYRCVQTLKRLLNG